MTLTQNLGLYQGEVVFDPVIIQTGTDRKCAFMSLRTFINELGRNGQWTTSTIDVPLMVLDRAKVMAVERYVRKGKTLLVRCYYKAWTDESGFDRHANVVTKMEFGPDGQDEDVVNWIPTPA